MRESALRKNRLRMSERDVLVEHNPGPVQRPPLVGAQSHDENRKIRAMFEALLDERRGPPMGPLTGVERARRL